MFRQRSLSFLLMIIIVPGFVLLTTSGCAEEGHHHDHHAIEKETGHGKNLGICPVMGGKATEEYSYVHEGKTYYFCCPGCIDSFKADPERYISRIKEFDLEAFQFGYSPERIEVKKGDIVRIFATSRDVPHGIYIKEYEVNTTVKKEEVKKIEFLADKTGEFPILCSIYCGSGHHDMKAVLVVE